MSGPSSSSPSYFVDLSAPDDVDLPSHSHNDLVSPFDIYPPENFHDARYFRDDILHSEPGYVDIPPPDYVDLSTLGIHAPAGWSNKKDDLKISAYFAPGCLMAVEIALLGYTNVLPIMTNRHDDYFVQAQRGVVKTFFMWNVISGRVMMVIETWSLKRIMTMVAISTLNIRMKLVAET